MSGRCYDTSDFYVCDKCGSFDVLSASERNFNSPMCNDCGSTDVSPNHLFNSQPYNSKGKKSFLKKENNGSYILEGLLFHDDKFLKKRRKKLIKKFGKSIKEHERNNNIDKLLK